MLPREEEIQSLHPDLISCGNNKSTHIFIIEFLLLTTMGTKVSQRLTEIGHKGTKAGRGTKIKLAVAIIKAHHFFIFEFLLFTLLDC
jgi:hypothetical protein